MNSYVTITTDIGKAKQYITDGRIVATPTGTSYGLAIDALQGHAVQRLRILKGRPNDQSFTVFMKRELWPIFLKLTGEEKQLLDRLDNQPLTLLVQPRQGLEHLAQDGRVGLRVIDDPLMAQLADACSVPLTATSSNRSGGQPCFNPDCIQQTFPSVLPDDRLDLEDPRGASGTTYDLSLAAILDAGELPTKRPSTIAQIINGNVQVVRAGELSVAELAR